MKRIISCLLAVALVLAPCAQASALGLESQVNEAAVAGQEENAPNPKGLNGIENPQQPDPVVEEPMVTANETDVQEQLSSESGAGGAALSESRKEEMGQMEVTIVSALIMKSPVVFTVSVTGKNGEKKEEKVTLGASTAGSGQGQTAAEKVNAVFKGLTPQEYTITVTAPGSAPYTQTVSVEDSMVYKIQIITGAMGNYEESGSHPGIIRIGDVNGDGLIDDSDRDALIDVIEGNVGEGLQTDLNGDGKTNLADLEYFTKSYKADVITSTVEKQVPAERVTISQNSVTVVSGNIEDILTDQGDPVKLSPANGETISEQNPIEVGFQLDEQKTFPMNGIIIGQSEENAITQAEIEITYEDENGQEQTATAPYNEAQVEEGIHYLLKSAAAQSLGVTVKKDPINGSICLNLGAQVPVKKVTIRIFGTAKNNDLAEISKVEFIGDMASRIPEPQMDIPQNVRVENASMSFTVTWNPCVNVTGYEVWVAAEDAKDKPVVKQVTGNTLKITSIGEGKEGKIKNGKKYLVKVQSVNGTWRSGYSEEMTAAPEADKVPDAPDYVGLTGKYRSFTASWKAVEDAEFYNVYYKKAEGETQYTKISDVTDSNCTVSDLENMVKYEVYVTAQNAKGESAPSLKHWVVTVDSAAAEMPRYKRINEAGKGEVSGHIKSATVQGGGEMVESPLDEGSNITIKGTVDNDHDSYYRIHRWDLGGFNKSNKGLYYEFDQPYKIRNIGLQTSEAHFTDFSYQKIRYWDEKNNIVDLERGTGFTYETKTDQNGKKYFWIRFREPITTNKIKIGLARYLATEQYNLIAVSEVNFYHYDSLEDEIEDLYKDDLHSVLKETVTIDTINGLREKLNTPDLKTGEYHPDKKLLELDLQMAEDILNEKGLAAPVHIHKSITTKDVGRGFGGLNAWQPLGVTAAAGEKLNIYVGDETKNAGESSGLNLHVSQYHSESGGVIIYSKSLVVGKNQIEIPRREAPAAGCEAGGALYVEYTGARNDNDAFAVRVNGGVPVPILDLHRVTDRTERLARAKTYATELADYVEKMEQTHKELHQVSENELVNVPYSKENCILGATDILLDTMMLSLPATQILAGASTGGTTAEARAERIVTSMEAMEGMMNLFYQHKGLNNSAAAEIDRFPNQHLNIRYQRMFAGAFMYAGGNHIGIEYGSASGLMGGNPVKADADGRYVSGRYFGWGIAHEIGHCINQGTYAIAETTNNYFSVLAQAKDTNDSVRFQYRNVYDKVTSGTKGPASNVFTQLAMYWQLHLAYDNGYNYKTYGDHKEQLANLFFARVDFYCRTPKKAPNPGGVELNLEGDKDQVLMRLSCAATERNLLEFFERWGKTPDKETRDYAEQFKKETRAIFYANDEARVHRLSNPGSKLETKPVSSNSANVYSTLEAVGDGTTAVVNTQYMNQVDITLQHNDAVPINDILGYDITRCMISNGDVIEQVVGFAQADSDGNATFTDTVTTINNRVVFYKVALVDKYLYRSAIKELAPVKIEHDGEIAKMGWTVSVNNISSSDTGKNLNETDDPVDLSCGPQKEDPITRTIDDKLDTAYTGTTKEGAEVILEFNQPQTVVAFKYTDISKTPIGRYSISVQDEKGGWNEVATGTYDGNGESQTVYFAKGDVSANKAGNIAAYETEKVKVSFEAEKAIAISELDVLGVTGDNVDIRSDHEGQPAIGILKEAYTYGTGKEDVIPAGSMVFIGQYKGNSAYNVVLLYDQDGNIVGGVDEKGAIKAQQLVFAKVPETGPIEETYDGTWIYWIEPKDQEGWTAPNKVRAELYRVDNALTNEGQRMVSDSLFQEVPSPLPGVTISGIGTGSSSNSQ